MNRHLTHAVTAVAAVAAVAFTWSWAQSAPNPGARTIPYQGYLELNGAAASPTTPSSMTFTLSDGSSTWAECYAAVPVSAGRFSVELGSFPGACASCTATSCSDGGGVPAWAFQTDDLRLAIAVNGTSLGEQRIKAVPYSVTAARADLADHATLADRAVDEGHVGEIRYSLLDLTTFQSLYGEKWELLAGQDITDPILTNQLGSKLPDARGMFLRGMNNGRTDAFKDPQSGRTVGHYQSDGAGEHGHYLIDGQGTGASNYVGALGPTKESPLKVGNEVGMTMTGPGIVGETRPKNITVNAFVKVQE